MPRLALDERDLQMLAILSREGRISKAELARRVNLSPTPCWERLDRMMRAGLIRAVRAELALDLIAPHVTVFVMVELDTHRSETFQTFERSITAIDEITQCWALGGGYDYVMKVIAPDVAAYQQLMDSLLERRIGVRRYFSYIVTKPVKSAAPPLGALVDGSS